MVLILRVFLLVLFSVVASEADVYRYVDENGIVCYTDIPLNKNAERIIRSPAAAIQRDATGASERKDFHSIVKEKADKYEIDPSLVHAVIKAESNGNPHAISRKGAMGLMQLMPTTANELRVGNPFDPEENIDGGTRYLKYLIERFNGDLVLALAAYNAGPKSVEKTGSIPPYPETKHYIKRVLSHYNGKTYYNVSSNPPVRERPDPIYKVLAEDGSVLFTNSPLYKKYHRY
ncbi:MAG: hypothetical protein OHK0032_16250 [Thermodesulfovibrionales bacterium]